MRRCLNCRDEFSGPSWTCTSCGFAPHVDSTYLSFIAEPTEDGSFVRSSFALLASAEEGFWWFESRNELIEWAMAKWCSPGSSFLEIGCGTGFVASRIARCFTNITISAAELFPEGLHFVAQRLPKATMYQIDARDLPFRKEFDVIGAFDVIEHIEDDVLVLSEMRAALKPAGIALITVPQHPFLWSRFDTYGHHKRRYTRRELADKLENAGFELLDLRAFVSFLFPILLMARLIPSNKEYDVYAEFRIAPLMNAVLRAIMRMEVTAIKAGVSFPFGGSLLAVARAR